VFLKIISGLQLTLSSLNAVSPQFNSTVLGRWKVCLQCLSQSWWIPTLAAESFELGLNASVKHIPPPRRNRPTRLPSSLPFPGNAKKSDKKIPGSGPKVLVFGADGISNHYNHNLCGWGNNVSNFLARHCSFLSNITHTGVNSTTFGGTIFRGESTHKLLNINYSSSVYFNEGRTVVRQSVCFRTTAALWPRDIRNNRLQTHTIFFMGFVDMEKNKDHCRP